MDEGLISYSGSSQFEILGAASAADSEGLVRFALGSTGETAGIILRHQSNGNMYLARYDGAGGFEVMYRSGGWTVVGKVPFSLPANSYYWLRFRIVGSNIYLRAWADGTAEP
ncbi:MAG TPA: hypothetical protein VMU49_02115, partial [Candidatus Acidoferrales bacterium]|nr:hypothetical protein [Candidatus Acidoferrales bacterium]